MACGMGPGSRGGVSKGSLINTLKSRTEGKITHSYSRSSILMGTFKN